MLPIAAPAIAAPAVAPASPVLAEGILTGSAPAGTPTPETAAQSGVDPGIFALLLAPAPVAEPAVIPLVIPEVASEADTGLAQLFSAFLGEAAESSEDAAKDGELLALLASFGATAVQTQPAAAADHLTDVLGEPLTASPSGAVPVTTVTPLPADITTISMPVPVPVPVPVPAADGIADDAAAAVPEPLPLPPAPQPAAAMLPATGQHIVPVAEQPTTPQLPAAMPVVSTEVATKAVQTATDVPAAPILAASAAVADAGRTSPASSLRQNKPTSTLAAVPIAEVEPAPVAEALAVVAPTTQVAAAGELPKPKPVQAMQAETMPTTLTPEQPVLAVPVAAPPVAAALPAAGPLPPPAQAPGASAPHQLAAAAEAVAEVEAEAVPAAPHTAAPAAAAVAADGSSQAIVAAPRSEPFAAVLRSEAAQPATGRSEPNPLERAVAHQVSRAVVQHLPDGGARMVMRLTPPELGTVRIEFISRDGMVTARLMAEDEGVRQALDRALPHIRAEVRGDHPTVDISVDRSDQRQAWSEGHARQERRDEPRTGQGRRQREDEPLFSVDGVEPTAAPTPVRAAQQLGGRVGPTLVDALA